jgi:HEAT repeat protein
MSRVAAKYRSPSYVTSLLDDLDGGGTARRAKAAALLGAVVIDEPEVAARAEPGLSDALGDDNRFVRVAAANALINIDRRRPPGPLVDRLRAAEGGGPREGAPDADEVVRLGLQRLRSLPLFDLFAPWMASPDPVRRSLAAKILGDSGDERAAELLVDATVDPDTHVAATAVTGLSVLGGQRARSHLRSMVRSGGVSRRLRAARALRRLRSVSGPG